MKQSVLHLFVFSALFTLTAATTAFANGGHGNQGGHSNQSFHGGGTQFRHSPYRRYPRRPRRFYSSTPRFQGVPVEVANLAAPKAAESTDVYNLKCSLAGEAVQEIQSMNVNLKELSDGNFQIWGNLADAQNRSRSLNVLASGELEENIALKLANDAGEITLRTEKDEQGEEYLTGKVTLLGLSDEEGLSCGLSEVQR